MTAKESWEEIITFGSLLRPPFYENDCAWAVIDWCNGECEYIEKDTYHHDNVAIEEWLHNFD